MHLVDRVCGPERLLLQLHQRWRCDHARGCRHVVEQSHRCPSKQQYTRRLHLALSDSLPMQPHMSFWIKISTNTYINVFVMFARLLKRKDRMALKTLTLFVLTFVSVKVTSLGPVSLNSSFLSFLLFVDVVWFFLFLSLACCDTSDVRRSPCLCISWTTLQPWFDDSLWLSVHIVPFILSWDFMMIDPYVAHCYGVYFINIMSHV